MCGNSTKLLSCVELGKKSVNKIVLLYFGFCIKRKSLQFTHYLGMSAIYSLEKSLFIMYVGTAVWNAK